MPANRHLSVCIKTYAYLNETCITLSFDSKLNIKSKRELDMANETVFGPEITTKTIIFDKPTIFIVDSDEMNIKIIAEILSDTHDIRGITSGDEALQLINDGIKPNLILLEVMLPDMDDFAVCKVLKGNNSTSDMPIIFSLCWTIR